MAAAGNDGPSHIATPCDTDSILCVGATDVDNNIANFSSVGPASDGRIKPDVSSIGKGAMCIYSNGNVGSCDGTSFASPVTCGMVACLIQANPTSTMLEIVNSVKQSAHQYSSPDNSLGYGIPNACAADSILHYIGSVKVEEHPFNKKNRTEFVFCFLSKIFYF